jgi:hypothetical protein
MRYSTRNANQDIGFISRRARAVLVAYEGGKSTDLPRPQVKHSNPVANRKKNSTIRYDFSDVGLAGSWPSYEADSVREGTKRCRVFGPEHVNGLETHLFTSLTSNWV